MMTIMRHKLFIAFGLTALMTLSSCGEDFLYKAPQGAIDEEALTNQVGVDLLVTNAYANLTENDWGASPFNWTFGGMYGGDANKGSDSNDQSVLNEMEVYKTLPTNDYLLQKWRWVYKGAKRTNVALQVLANATDMTPDFAAARAGELKFLRALSYFEGVKVFGGMIPWVDETITDNNPLVHNDIDIYPNILADLDDAISKLPDGKSDVSPGRANVWAAKALKAKVLMQQGNMAAAKPLLKEVIESGKTADGITYGLEDDLTANWDLSRENGKEAIFAIQFSVNAQNNANSGMSLCYPHGGAGNPGGCCGFYQPSNELANSFKVDENGLPLLDNSYRNGDPVSYRNPSSEDGAAISLNNNMAVDPRLDFSMGRFGIPYKDWGLPKNGWVRDVANGGFFLPKKHVYYKADEDNGLASGGFHGGWAPGSAMNVQYLSLRDCILLYAECLANDGELSAAMEQVNKIRTRAANDVNIIMLDGKPAANYKVAAYPSTHAAFTNKETCIKAIRMERKLELAMEGQRWFDLTRWGGDYMAQQLKDYVDFEKKYIIKFASAQNLPASKTMFPLPDTQIDVMGVDENGKNYLEQPSAWK